MNILAILFVKKYVPETKGRSLEQLEHSFRQYGRRADQKSKIKQLTYRNLQIPGGIYQ